MIINPYALAQVITSPVSLLLHFNEASGATSTTDASEAAHTITFRSGSTISDTSQKFGPGSLAVPNAGGVSVSVDETLQMRDSDFTVEGWALLSAYGNCAVFQSNVFASAVDDTIQFRVLSATQVYWEVGSKAELVNFVFGLNAFRHVAVTREGNQARLFIDGVQVGTTLSNPGTLPTIDRFTIGDGLRSGSSSTPWNGYIDEFRVTKGQALYIANFTPPTAPFPNPGAGATTGAAVLADLVAWWDFEQNGSGTSFLDSHGGNPLTLSDSTTSGRSTASGRKGRASNWPNAPHSSSAYVPRANTSMDANGPFTLGAWIYFNEMPADDLTRFLLGRLGGVGAQQICYAVQLRTQASQQQFNFLVRNSSDTALISAPHTTGLPLAAGQWYFVVMGVAPGVFRRYVNGVKEEGAYTDGVQSGGNSNFSIGNGRRADTTDWDNSRTVGMRVDSVFYMNRGITDAEVALLYNGGAGMSYADLLAAS